MAIIIRGQTKCALCREVIDEGDDIVATSHFIGDSADPLWQYSDAAVHKRCFMKWDLRKSFIDRFNDVVGGITFGNGTRRHMEADGSINVLSS